MVRVVHCGTGTAGIHGLRGIINHPDLELVGLYVNTPSKIGVDAGVLCGLEPVGVLGTADFEETLRLYPDCLSYMAEGWARPAEAATDIARFLETGANVVTTSMLYFLDPSTSMSPHRQQIEQACALGHTTMYNTGINPGIASWAIPVSLLSAADEVRSVRILEIMDYNYYDNDWILRDVVGFGKPPDFDSLIFSPMMDLKGMYGGTFEMMAQLLGVELDEVRFVHEKSCRDKPLESATLGTIEPGTVSAIHFRIEGLVGGVPFIVHEHVTRIADDAAPEWDQPRPGHHTYRVTVEGNPKSEMEWHFKRDDPDSHLGPAAVTAMHAINAIPVVCDAKPGVVGYADLPVYTARNVRPAHRG